MKNLCSDGLDHFCSCFDKRGLAATFDFRWALLSKNKAHKDQPGASGLRSRQLMRQKQEDFKFKPCLGHLGQLSEPPGSNSVVEKLLGSAPPTPKTQNTKVKLSPLFLLKKGQKLSQDRLGFYGLSHEKKKAFGDLSQARRIFVQTGAAAFSSILPSPGVRANGVTFIRFGTLFQRERKQRETLVPLKHLFIRHGCHSYWGFTDHHGPSGHTPG